MITLWIGTAIGATVKLGGSIFGGIKATQAADEAAQETAEQRKKNQEWYNRRYNEDATQRADAQRLLTHTEETIRQRNKAAAGSQAVMGGTSASVAADKAANSKAVSDVAANIAANADARKDAIEATYMQNDNALSQQQAQIARDRAANIASAVQGAANTGAAIMGISTDDEDLDNLNSGGE